jgi:hypothetical protein
MTPELRELTDRVIDCKPRQNQGYPVFTKGGLGNAHLVSSPERVRRSMSIVDLSGKLCKSARATASPTTPRVSG